MLDLPPTNPLVRLIAAFLFQGCWHLPAGAGDDWLCLDVPRGLRLGLDKLPIPYRERPRVEKPRIPENVEGEIADSALEEGERDRKETDTTDIRKVRRGSTEIPIYTPYGTAVQNLGVEKNWP